MSGSGRPETVVRPKLADWLAYLGLLAATFWLYQLIGRELASSLMRPFGANDLLFEMDIARSVDYLANASADFYRTSVHPLYAMLANPLGATLVRAGIVPPLAAILVNAFLGALAVVLAYRLFRKMGGSIFNACCLSLLFAFTASQLILSSIPDTQSLAIVSLLVLYSLFWFDVGQERLHWMAWLAAGVFVLGVTTTNFIQAIICFQMTVAGRQKTSRLLGWSLLYVIGVVSATVLFALIQHSIYPSATLFFLPSAYIAELRYSNDLMSQQPWTVLSQVFKHGFVANLVAPAPATLDIGRVMPATSFVPSWRFGVLGFLSLTGLAGLAIAGWGSRHWRGPARFLQGLGVCLLFNLVFHCFYGIDQSGKIELFLYTGNFTFPVLLLLSAGCLALSRPWLRVGLVATVVVLAMNNGMAIRTMVRTYDDPARLATADVRMKDLVTELVQYRKEVRALRQQRGEPRELAAPDTYLFGVGTRPKYSYGHGTLREVASGTIVRRWQPDAQFVVPSAYTVALVTPGGHVFISEDETGIRIDDNGQRETLYEGERMLLPDGIAIPR